VSLGLVMALSVSRLSQGKRGKPGPRSPTCRELTYPAPRGSLVLPASSGKRLLLFDAYDHVAVALAGSAHRAEPVDHRVLKPDQVRRPDSVWRAGGPERQKGEINATSYCPRRSLEPCRPPPPWRGWRGRVCCSGLPNGRIR
jgi:hypothetical protein